MEVIEDPANDGLKCQASKRVFKIDQNGCDGNPACEANCVATCEEDPTCKAMIVQTNSCSGFNSVLDKTANAGSKAYKKVTATAGACGGEDVPAGVYCKFTFCPAPTCVEINQCVGSRRWRGGQREDSARRAVKL